jgi:pimeloyl-ACP methyl ester carboxylesterase
VSDGGVVRGPDDYGLTAEPNWRTVDWARHLARVRIGRTPVNYVRLDPPQRRDGAVPVVFVHGLSGQWQNWLENLPATALERPAVALDLPGFGRSPLPANGTVSIPYYASVVARLCAALGFDRYVVCGNSMGGLIAAELALREPGRVQGLVLVSPAGVSSATVKVWPAVAVGTVVRLVGVYGGRFHRHVARRRRARALGLALVARYPQRLDADLACEGLIKGAGKPGFAPALRATVGYDLRERLPEIAVPTLVVWGKDDRVIPVRDADVWASRIANTEKVILPRTGHVAQLERPRTFNRLLHDFVARVDAQEHTPTTAASAS